MRASNPPLLALWTGAAARLVFVEFPFEEWIQRYSHTSGGSISHVLLPHHASHRSRSSIRRGRAVALGPRARRSPPSGEGEGGAVGASRFEVKTALRRESDAATALQTGTRLEGRGLRAPAHTMISAGTVGLGIAEISPCKADPRASVKNPVLTPSGRKSLAATRARTTPQSRSDRECSPDRETRVDVALSAL